MGIAELEIAAPERNLIVAKENEIKRLRTANGKLVQEVEQLTRLLDRYSTIKPEDTKVPTWLKPKRKTKAHRATGVLLLSDLHLDEVVDLHEMDGINEYNRAIANERLERIINATVDLLHTYVSGVHYDGLVVPLLGDNITGVIHDELERTNEAPPSASIVHWVPIIASALTYLADEFGRLYVPCVDGNHDRFYKKTPKKQRAESSLAWVIYNWLADHLRDDDRITFGISTSPEQLIDVYDTTLLLSHGDGFRSAGGVGGLYPSLLKWLLRKHDLYSQTKRDFDIACIGHWHQDLYGQDFVVNGSPKGYDEYAKDGGFKFAKPSQQLFTLTPERGMGQRLTVQAV
jgi:predicted phosphodiesterase